MEVVGLELGLGWFSTRSFSNMLVQKLLLPLYFQSLAQPGAQRGTLYEGLFLPVGAVFSFPAFQLGCFAFTCEVQQTHPDWGAALS